VAAVRQLDQDDAHIASHRQQHLAERFGLVFLAGVEFQLFQLGQAVHQFRDRRAKTLDQLRLGDAAVLDRIVQQGGHQGLCVQLPFGALLRHGDRMGDVGQAAVAYLAQMRFIGKAVGGPDVVDVLGAHVVQLGRERSKTRRSCVGGSRG